MVAPRGRRLFLLAVVLAFSGCAGATIAGRDAAHGCFEAAERPQPLHAALRRCDSALLAADLAPADRAATLVNRGIVNMQARRIDAALADYDAAITLAPSNAEAYINKGIALLHAGGRESEAIEQLNAGLARGPIRPEIAYFSRAMANETLGRNRDAYEDYGRAARLAPDWPEPGEQLLRFKVVRRKTASG